MAAVGQSVRSGPVARHWRLWLLVASTTVLGLAVAGLLASPRVAAPPTVVLHPSWAMGYASVDELQAAADLAVVARVSDVVAEGPDLVVPEIPATVFRLAVERTLKGAPGPTILVVQTGGLLHGTHFMMEGDPLMRSGDRYLLYLARVPSGPYVERYGTDVYFVLGGPDGRFAVAPSGQLTPLGQVVLPAGTTVERLYP